MTTTDANTRATATRSDDLEAFTSALDAFMHASRRARTRLPEEALDLSLSQFELLRALDGAEGPLGVSALAQAAEVSVPTVTRMLDGLERRGVVVRDRDERDRRVVRVSLTRRGEQLVATKREVVRQRRTALYESLAPDERRDAARLLCRLAAALADL